MRTASGRRVRPRTFVALALVCTLGCAGLVAADERPIQPSDLLRLRTVEEIEVSRDGRHAVWVVRSIAPDAWSGDDETYAQRSNLWYVDLFDRQPAPRQITFGAAIDSSPRLSPDGSRLAFVRAADGAPGQLHVLELGGGEARPLTALERGVSAPSWSPDGRALVVVSNVDLSDLPSAPPWSQERPRRTWNDEPFTGTLDAPAPRSPSPDGTRSEQREWLARQAKAGDPRVFTRLEFVSERALRSELSFDHLFVIEVDGTTAPRRVTTVFADHAEPAFMPDGERIVFCTTARDAAIHPDRIESTALWSIRVDGTDERPLLQRDGWTYASPQPSRDGSAVAFRARRTDELAYRQWMLGVISTDRMVNDRMEGDPTGGERSSEPSLEPIPITPRLDRSVRRFVWHAGDSFLLTVADSGGFPLLAFSAAVPDPIDIARLDEGVPVGVHAFAAGGGAIVYAQTTPMRPMVLRVRDGTGDRELMDLNPWIADRWIASPTERWITRPDGLRVQAWVIEPRRVRRAERQPLLLLIHGGPNAMWGPGEVSMWHEMQVLAGAGFGIVYTNPRGSGGYGFAFERANRQDWGPGPAGDVLAAVDVALTEPWVDRERLGVAGGSYGGFLTAWILTRDTRFKAAVADRGVYDLDAFFGEGSAWRLVERSFGGSPFDGRVRDTLDRHRPVLDARRIRTPLLIMHGDADRRTGYVQSEMLYRALKALDRPVEYVRYPRADHDMSRRGEPRQRIDRIVRMVEFLDRYLPP